MSRLKKQPPPEEKLRVIQTLYMQVYNDSRSLIPLSVELFHILGSILEGVAPKDLPLELIDRETLLTELSLNGDT